MRLVLCDANRILGEALSAGLQPRGHQVVAITTSVRAGVAAVTEHRPDACLLDPRFAGSVDSIAALQAFRLSCPGTAVVLFSGVAMPNVRQGGAAGFISKNQDVGQIAQALDVISAGGTVFDFSLARHTRPAGPARANFSYELTQREREVLRRMVAGQSTGQMAGEMKITIGTLRTYVKNILAKLGTHSRLQAAALARREGLVAELSA